VRASTGACRPKHHLGIMKSATSTLTMSKFLGRSWEVMKERRYVNKKYIHSLFF